MSSLIIYPSPWKLVRGVVAGVALTALFLAMIQFHQPWHLDSPWWYIAYPGAPLAALATLYWLVRLLRRRPMLTVTPEGITDTSSIVGVGLIRWEEITQLGLKTTKLKGGKNIYLTITPKDMHALLARQSSPLTKLYDSVGNDGSIEIGQVMLPLKVDALLHQIEAYYQAQVRPGVASVSFDHIMHEI